MINILSLALNLCYVTFHCNTCFHVITVQPVYVEACFGLEFSNGLNMTHVKFRNKTMLL